LSKQNSDEILKFIDEHGVEDKDSTIDREQPMRSRKRGSAQIEKSLDLHGFRTEEAEKKIRATIKICSKTGVKKLIIIHGKGHHSDPFEGPILKGVVESMLANELRDSIRDFNPAPLNRGGAGATVVTIR